MSKFIGVKLVDAVVMTAGEARAKGYRVNQDCIDETHGYEVTYEGGYKSWSPADVFEKAYYKLADVDGNSITYKDVKGFVKQIDNVKVGTKTTNTTLTCLTGFEVHGQSSCVRAEDFDINVGFNYAQIKAEDKIWEGLGFVLQWAKYGLNKNNNQTPIEDDDITATSIPPHVQRMMAERDELKDRVFKLDKFIGSNRIFFTLSEEEQKDMNDQLISMITYLDCLERRITRANIR